MARSTERVLATWLLVAVSLGAAGPAPAALKDPAPSGERKIAQLIDSLGDKEYAVRQRAEEDLARIGFPAYEALEAAANHEDLEIATRARYLLRKIRAQWASGEDPPEVQKLLAQYELLPVDERARRIRELAFLPERSGTSAVCRLVRFDRLASLSDYAAIQIMYSEPFDPASRAEFKGVVRSGLGASTRPAAKRLLAYMRLRDDPKTALPEWHKIVEAEYARWQRAPEKVRPETVVGLLYLLAESCAAQGDQAAAEKAAGQAQAMPRPADYRGLDLHMQTAWMLVRRGCGAWSEAEYRFLMSCGNPAIVFDSGGYFGRYLHEQGKDLAAAEAYEQALEASRQLKFRSEEDAKRLLGHARARMNYSLACHWFAQGDAARQMEYLERALQADPGEVDALIACYRLPNPPPQFRERTVKSIQEQAAEFRKRMSSDPKPALACNQFAWLVCNTQGDLDEALRASQRSLELTPGDGSYLDTLAHVYFAKGDLASAIKYQEMAVQRSPHSVPLNAALKRFRATLEAKTKAAPGKPETKTGAAKDQNK